MFGDPLAFVVGEHGDQHRHKVWGRAKQQTMGAIAG